MDPQIVARELLRLEKIIQLYYEIKAYRNIVQHLDVAIKYAPHRLEYHVLKAECLALLGRYDESSDITDVLIKLDKTAADAHYIRGLCLYLNGNFAEGIAHFKRALRLDPKHKKAKDLSRKNKSLKELLEKGKILCQSGCYQQAKIIYTEALQTDETHNLINCEILHNRALVNWKIGALSEAIADCTRILETDAGFLRALLLRANCYKDCEKFKESVKDYKAALKLQETPEIKQQLREAKKKLKEQKPTDYYKILGIQRDATKDEIKKAYRQKALVHHPDRHGNKSPDARREEELHFKKVNEAYAILSNVGKKTHYDRALRRKRKSKNVVREKTSDASA